VAADKGTATFSDIANAVSADYGFWLGDAFASGGSAGYDHKEMGITARGAWESVKRHFRELGVDCQSTDFTCVGIGDMSGDVFGNGLLLSRHTRLLAAFDHRHVFVDPDPDAAASWEERKRLFELPRSSWDDYDRGLMSPGGGVFARTMKSVPISPQMRATLQITEGVDHLTPADLIRCILAAPVDLLFNGGIGTYVKSEGESHAQVGDRANDAVRINGSELRARCVGEGGNLGLTQAGRIEYALAGGRLTTDFIDNSAGVDTSDHEVNMKILLDRVVAAGDMTLKQRNALLASMTDEVADLVLSHNRSQNVALSCARSQSAALAHVHDDWMRRLEAKGELDRRLEGLPASAQLSARQQAGAGLTEPELSVLLAYTKISLTHELLSSDLPEDEDLFPLLVDYFPRPMQERFTGRLNEHRLHREIIATRTVNEMVDFGGITMYPRLSAETGAAVADIARAHMAARTIFRTEGIWSQITKLDNVISASVQTRARLATRLIAERATRWFVNNHRAPLRTAELVAHYAAEMGPLIEALPDVLIGRAAERLALRRQQLVDDGLPPDLAARIAVLPQSYPGLGMIAAAERNGIAVVQIARVHAAIGEELNLDRLLDKVLELPRDDQWRTMARAALRDDLNSVHIRIVEQALHAGDAAHDDPAAIVAQWRTRESAQLTRVRGLLEGLVEGPQADLAKLQVALRLVRQLVPAA
jgi:glutamate dehydrogenase